MFIDAGSLMYMSRAYEFYSIDFKRWHYDPFFDILRFIAMIF